MTALRRVLAVLIALRGLSNFGKPFDTGSGFVIAGRLMHGVAATVVAPLFGAGMLVYAWGLWHAKPWAFPVAVAYAIWATANVLLFPIFESMPPGIGAPGYALFAAAGIGGPWLAAWGGASRLNRSAGPSGDEGLARRARQAADACAPAARCFSSSA